MRGGLSRRLGAYLASRLSMSRGLNLLRAVHQGTWLGLLDRRTLQELTDHYYGIEGSGLGNGMSGSAGEEYSSESFNRSGLEAFEEAVYETHLRDCNSILVGSAGGGREVLALSARGRRVEAFECNPTLLRACLDLLRSEGTSARVVAARPGRVPRDLGVYDGAICGWGSYMHVVGRQHRVELLRDFHTHLRPGGPLLLSFFTRRDSRSGRMSIRLARMFRWVRRAAPVEDGDSISDTFDHCFSEHEIRAELADGGFETVLYSEEGYGHAVGRAVPAIGQDPEATGVTNDSNGPAPALSASLRVRAYLRSRHWTERMLDWLQSLHQGFWLGLLDREARQELTEHHYASVTSGPNGSARYSDPSFNLSGLRPWEEAAVERYFGDCRSILVGSAGGGREALALSLRGFRVEAFECNPRLLEHCRSLVEAQGADVPVIGSVPDQVPESLGSYSGAILGWCAYIHILGRERRVRLLQQLLSHLEAGSPLLISFVLRDPSVGRAGYGVARALRWARRGEPLEPGDWVGSASGRSFTEEDIRSELAEAGFETAFYSVEGCGHAVARALPAEPR